MNNSSSLDTPEVQAILAERARALARDDELAAADIGEPTLSFLLGGARYCLPATAVRETLRLSQITPLPAVPPVILGLTNVRGRLLTCIDLRPLLDLSPTPPDAAALLLIVAAAGLEMGLLVDTVLAVHPHTMALEPTPAALAGRGVAWVRGVDADLALHIDPELLLRDERLLVSDATEPIIAAGV
jgi:purine-binding chemotaxis protein CheW